MVDDPGDERGRTMTTGSAPATARTSDDYCQCLQVYPDGRTRRANALAAKIQDTEAAEHRLRSDFAATIAGDDWPALCERMNADPPGRWRPVVGD